MVEPRTTHQILEPNNVAKEYDGCHFGHVLLQLLQLLQWVEAI